MSTEPAHLTLERWKANGILDALGALAESRAIVTVPRSGGRTSDGWIVDIGHGGLSVGVRFVDKDGEERGKHIATRTLITANPALFPAGAEAT